MNLTTNAYDSLNGEAGIVRVTTGVRDIDEAWLQGATVRDDMGRVVYVEVEDSGCGMDEETLSRVFRSVFHHKIRRARTGTGGGARHCA